MQPICIIGTDTGIGKTYTCCKIMQYLISKNRTTTTLKPISSGVSRCEYGLLNADVYQLYKASNYKLDFNQINPFQYPLAVAPHIAAKQHGSTLNVKLVYKQMQKIFNAIIHTNNTVADHVFIEGVGGLMVPLNPTETFLDLLANWNYPIILVVGMKLGCLNHTLLTLQTLQQKKLTILGWAANQIEAQMPYYHENLEYLTHKLDELAVPLLATIAYQDNLKPTLKFKELFKCN
ncbi:MAG: dethiobiotin synthetase [Pseudomonadota bacterium]|nr:dethiobiotin synthetase [Pseudomonadota bacterium]